MLKLILFAAVPTIVIGLTNPAATQIAPTVPCPPLYEHLTGGLCFKSSNGDIVLAGTLAALPRLSSANCRKGYVHMVDNLCFHPRWGDVVFAETAPSGITTASIAGCPAGYVILINKLCFNGTTGDIVYSAVEGGTTISTAKE